LEGPLALYRDLVLGDQGDDVSSLQQSFARAGLDVSATGTVDRQLLAAVAALFESAGYADPGTIQVAAFAEIPAPAVEVASAAAFGSEVSEASPLLTIVTAPQHIAFRVDPISVDEVSVGVPVTATVSGNQFDGTVAAVGEFTDGEGLPPGRDVVVTIDDPAFLELSPGVSASIAASGQVVEGLAIPAAALREDVVGTYVTVRVSDTQTERVDVDVLLSGGGWVAVEAVELTAGDLVLTS